MGSWHPCFLASQSVLNTQVIHLNTPIPASFGNETLGSAGPALGAGRVCRHPHLGWLSSVSPVLLLESGECLEELLILRRFLK